MLFTHKEFEHETVVFGRDPSRGFKSIIAIHSSRRGPAIGGCRMMAYRDERSALTDVLRLSRGMTYKCAIGDIPFGGGKSVIIGNPETDKTKELLHAMGDFVDQLGGSYITSFDSGTTIEDIAVIGERTAHVGGIKAGAGNASSSTAYGIYVCMRESARLRFGSGSLEGLVIAIQGAGNVGSRLAKLVAEDGARVIVADIDDNRAADVARSVGADVCPVQKILGIDCDIFSPCALGAVLTSESVWNLSCAIVCGGANNQLSDKGVADTLVERDILYCPDYLANAGGIIDLHYQLNEPSRDALLEHLHQLAHTLRDCFEYAQANRCSMSHATDRVAESRLG